VNILWEIPGIVLSSSENQARFPSSLARERIRKILHLSPTISTKDAAEAQKLKWSVSLYKLTDELLGSDLLVIATPTWNFSIPSSLKAWIDLVVRPGKTFSYTNDGVLGLAKGKKAILVLASGGVFTEGPWKSWDFVEPYLRKILSFIGIDTVQTVRPEGRISRPLQIVPCRTQKGPLRTLPFRRKGVPFKMRKEPRVASCRRSRRAPRS